MHILNASFVRAFTKTLTTLLVVSSAAYLWDGYYDGKWWDVGYIESLSIPLVIFPVIVWFMFVPKRLEYSESDFVIDRRFAKICTLPWSQLRYYGPGNNVFMIQFEGRQAFQLFAGAYGRSEWAAFLAFLSNRFPHQRASGYLGARMFKWRKRK
jgi:hypothetical protein